MSSDRTQLFEQGTMVYPLDPGLAVASENCPHCSSAIAVGDQFCARCGYQRGTWKVKKIADAPLAATPSAQAGVDVANATYRIETEDGREFFLAPGDWVVGRGDVDLRIDNGYISRSHARISVAGDALTIIDLGSSNGTFVGGQRIAPNEPVVIAVGEEVGLGQYKITLFNVEQVADIDSTAVQVVTEPVAIVEVEEEAAEFEVREASPWAIVAESGEAIDLPLGPFTIGRKADRADYAVGDSYVSSLHCRLAAAESTLTLTDLGSTNGTFIGDVQLAPEAPQELHDGDTFRLGQTNFTVHYTGGMHDADDVETPAEPNEPQP